MIQIFCKKVTYCEQNDIFIKQHKKNFPIREKLKNVIKTHMAYHTLSTETSVTYLQIHISLIFPAKKGVC